MPHISVIIPVYKAEGSLEELYRRLKIALETITSDFEMPPWAEDLHRLALKQQNPPIEVRLGLIIESALPAGGTA